MQKYNLRQLFLDNFDYEPTISQHSLIDSLVNFINDESSSKVFIVKGYAGTGKTTVVSALVKTLKNIKLKSLLLAPTGRSAKVLSLYSGKKAYTIHRKIYKMSLEDGGLGRFILGTNTYSDTFFIVDEASMISNSSSDISVFGSGRLLDDLIKFVYNEKRCFLILIGDTAQLPPVGLDVSPALDIKVLQQYNLNIDEIILTEVVRQSIDSGILANATIIRNIISKRKAITPKFKLAKFNDIKKVCGSELLEEISNSYDKNGMEDTMIVCRSNKRANLYNQGIRNQILWREDEISTGDYIMIVKNNYFWSDKIKEIEFIANGDIVQIVRIHKKQECYGHRFADVTIRLIDYDDIELDVKIILDTLTSNSPSLSSAENKQLFMSVMQDYEGVDNKIDRIKNDPFFNAMQIKFAYAVTCHKAQGGQWKSVFIDQDYFVPDMMNIEYLRWMYTAVTRSTEKLYLVNFNDSFFSEKE